MTTFFEKIQTEYAGKIFFSKENQVKYDGFTGLNGKEKALYELLETFGPDNIQSAIEKNPSEDTIFSFSAIRSNAISWLGISKDAKVLEVGAQYGAITSYLCGTAAKVDAVEPSLEKALINLKRNARFNNYKLFCGALLDIEGVLEAEYDYIILSEYCENSIGSEKYVETIKILNQHLTNDGKFIWMLNNRLGLRYFSGDKDLDDSIPFEKIEGSIAKHGELSLSKEAVIKTLKQAEVTGYSFYYPYPDYKLAHTIYSDDRLPKIGELTDNSKNFSGDRISLFDEGRAFDSIIEDGCFDRFSNSFLIVAGKRPDAIYAKLSLERSKECALITTIERNEENTFAIKKHAIFNEGSAHIANMHESYIRLCDKYSNTDLRINRCLGISEDCSTASFEYVEGCPLTEVLDKYLFSGNLAEFEATLDRYLSYLQEKSDLAPFDRDVIFDNILVNGNEWTLIDYEWCGNNKVDYKEIAFRSLHTYLVTNPKRNIFNYDLIYEKLGISPDEGRLINEKELSFQCDIKKNMKTLADLNALIGIAVDNPINNSNKSAYKFQIYRCDKQGSFSEANSFYYENAYGRDNCASVKVDVTDADHILRLDPLMDSCIVKLSGVYIDDRSIDINKKNVICNGKYIKPDIYLFPTKDPNLLIPLKAYLTPGFKGTLRAEMMIYPMPENVISCIFNSKRFW